MKSVKLRVEWIRICELIRERFVEQQNTGSIRCCPFCTHYALVALLVSRKDEVWPFSSAVQLKTWIFFFSFGSRKVHWTFTFTLVEPVVQRALKWTIHFMALSTQNGPKSFLNFCEKSTIFHHHQTFSWKILRWWLMIGTNAIERFVALTV